MPNARKLGDGPQGLNSDPCQDEQMSDRDIGDSAQLSNRCRLAVEQGLEHLDYFLGVILSLQETKEAAGKTRARDPQPP